MDEFITSLIKYTAIFICTLYAYSKLLRVKLKAWDLLEIPLFIGLSAVLYFVTEYIKMLVPMGFLIFSIAFLFLRFRKTFYETVTVGAIALEISIAVYVLSFLIFTPIAALISLMENLVVKNIIAQLSICLIQILCIFLLFKIKRFQSGINPKSKNATFDILLYLSVFCLFTMMLLYTKEVKQYLDEVVILVIALGGLLLIVWWRKHITYTYREAVKQRDVEQLANSFEEYKLNTAENDLQLAVYSKLFHYLNKVLPGCAYLAENVAEKTDSADACATRDMLQRVLREMNLANEKCSLHNIPQTCVSVIDVPIIQLYTAAERKNLKVSAVTSEDIKSWFSDNKINKDDIHILISYLCDNAIISALGSPDAKVRLELSATENLKPLICIYDSGEQFDEGVLAKLGLEQVTTRAGVGGSGIGLFTIFGILEKYGASFTLDEAPQIFGFTKSIKIAFDECHSFVVRTFRESAAKVCAARKGITIERIDLDLETLRDGTDG